MQLLQRVVLRTIEVPALNKWTQVYPSIAQTMLGFVHRLLPYGLAQAIKRKGLDDPEPLQALQLTQSNLFAAPVNDAGQPMLDHEKTWRGNKTCRFVSDSGNVWFMLVWLLCARHLINLHFKLFKLGKSHYQVLERDDRAARVQYLFDLCSRKRSQAVEIFDTYQSMLNPDAIYHRGYWGTLYFYADGRFWNEQVCMRTRNSV